MNFSPTRRAAEDPQDSKIVLKRRTFHGNLCWRTTSIGVNFEQSLNMVWHSVANAGRLRERVTGVLWTRVQLQCLAEEESGTASHHIAECRYGLRYRVQGIYHWFVPCIFSRLTH
jgi:hypothetical protein